MNGQRTITMLFCDMVGSTRLSAELEPDELRAAQIEFFAAMRARVEEHGGVVEKYIGDAVAAVFGVSIDNWTKRADLCEDGRNAVPNHAQLETPAANHALRAARAALEMRRSAAFAVHIGIDTGLAVTPDFDGEPFVTGRCVYIAAKLQEFADPGEILIGLATWQRIRAEMRAEPVPAPSGPAFRLHGPIQPTSEVTRCPPNSMKS